NGHATHRPPTEEPHLAPSDESRAELEERIRRLEEALAQMHEVRQRQAQEAAKAPVAAPVTAPVATIVATPPTPITTTPTDAATSFLFNFGKHLLNQPAPQPPPVPQESGFSSGMRWTWFFFESLAELRAIYRMFVDPRYSMSWAARLIPLL